MIERFTGKDAVDESVSKGLLRGLWDRSWALDGARGKAYFHEGSTFKFLT